MACSVSECANMEYREKGLQGHHLSSVECEGIGRRRTDTGKSSAERGIEFGAGDRTEFEAGVALGTDTGKS